MDSTCLKNRRLVGARIREIRDEQGLSLRKLALMIGMDHGTLSKVENGRLNPSLNTLTRISEGLGVDLFELFDVKRDSTKQVDYAKVRP